MTKSYYTSRFTVRLVHWGTAVICIIFAIIIAVVLCVKYPYGNGDTIFEHLFL